MLHEHSFKNLQIKPQTILESNAVLKVYDLQISSNLEARNDNKELFKRYNELFRDKTPADALPAGVNFGEPRPPSRGFT
jgi:hypothetical protein